MPVHESPGAGRVLIAAGSPLTPEPGWSRYDNLASCRCEGFDWNRGRQSEFDVTNTGTARVFFHDRDGTLSGEGLVGAQIMLQLFDPVAAAWQPVFRGHVDDISSSPSPGAPELTNTEIECVDIFDYLSGVKMVVGEMGDVTPAGTEGVVFYEDGPVDGRIEDLLDDAGLDPDMYVVFSGNVDLCETLYDPDDDILSAMRDAADAEFPGIANVYVDRFGRVAFHGRFARFDPDATAGSAGADDWDFQRWSAGTRGAGGAQVREFTYNRPRTRIVNSYVAWPELNPDHSVFNQTLIQSNQTKTDGGSIGSYGYRGRQAPSLIIKEHKTNGNTGAEECELYADFYVSNYSDVRKNVERITFRSVWPHFSTAAATWELMTKVDISDIIHLTIGEAGLSGEEFYVEGISGSCRHLNPDFDNVTVTPNLSPFAYYTDNVFEQMPDVVKHAQTHRSRGIGGTDPVPPDLPFVQAALFSQSITANAEAEWGSVATTDPDTFRWDPGDPAGLLIQRDGTYQWIATMRVSVGDASVERGISVQSGVMSGGPFGGSAVGDGTHTFSSGFREVTTDSDTVLPTTLLWEISVTSLFGSDVFDPYRSYLAINHEGDDFSCTAAMYIVKLANFVGMQTPPLPEEP